MHRRHRACAVALSIMTDPCNAHQPEKWPHASSQMLAILITPEASHLWSLQLDFYRLHRQTSVPSCKTEFTRDYPNRLRRPGQVYIRMMLHSSLALDDGYDGGKPQDGRPSKCLIATGVCCFRCQLDSTASADTRIRVFESGVSWCLQGKPHVGWSGAGPDGLTWRPLAGTSCTCHIPPFCQ